MMQKNEYKNPTPDVNKSKMDFDVEGSSIRYGLGAIKIQVKKI